MSDKVKSVSENSPITEGECPTHDNETSRNQKSTSRSSQVTCELLNEEEDADVPDVEDHDGASHEENQYKPYEKLDKKFCFGLGICLTVLSALCTATAGVIVKLSPFNGPQMTAVGGLGQAILITPVILYTGNSFFGKKGERWLLLGRSVFGGVAITCGYLSFQNLPLGDATTIAYSSPVFVSLSACIFLKEPCSIFLSVTILLTISGLIIMAKPSFLFGFNKILEKYPHHTEGLGYAFGDMINSVLVILILRRMKNTHHTAPVFGMALGTCIIGTVVGLATHSFTLPTAVLDGLYFVGVSVSGLLSQWLITVALKVEKAGPVSVVQSVIIVIAFIYQVTVFGDIPEFINILGVLLITSGVLLTSLKTLCNENPEMCSKLRKQKNKYWLQVNKRKALF